MLQLHPSETPLQAVALQREGLPSVQPGMLPHQQLLLTVPAPPPHVLPAPLPDAAADLYPDPGSLRNHFVTPAPLAQPLMHQNPQIIKSPCALN